MTRVLFFFTAALIFLTCFISGHETWMTAIPEQTKVYIVNPSVFGQEVRIRSYKLSGEVIGEETYRIEPKQRLIWHSSMDYKTTVSLLSAGGLLVDAIWEEGQSLYEQTSSEEKTTPLYFPHIAEQTDYWETKAWFTTGQNTRFTLQASSNRTLLPLKPKKSTFELNLEEIWLIGKSKPTTIPNPAWRMLQSVHGSAAGIYTFHNQSQTQSATLPIHFTRDTYLILPHIPEDRVTWWAGLVLLNPGKLPCDIEITWYLDSGEAVQTQTQLQPGEKRSGLLGAYDAPETALWAEIKSSQAILGFELFGTKNEQSLCGLPLSNHLSKTHVFSRTGTDLDWSGLAILNPGNDTLSVVMNQYDHEGVIVRSDSMEIEAKKRIRFIPEITFPVSSVEGSPWLELTSELGFSCFELVGKKDQSGLTALLGRSFSSQNIQLSYTYGIDDNIWNLNQLFTYQDMDFDGKRDFMLSGTEGFTLITDPVSNPNSTVYTFEEIGFEAQGPLPTEIAVADLNGDNLNEFLILDRKLHIFTKNNEQTMVRFQPQLPDLEGADHIAGLSDSNRDGFLDILTGRGYYKSLATLESPYFTNFYPYQLRTSGRASQFHDLNGDGMPDLFTSLLDSFHAFISYGSTDDIGDPLYTPKELEYILATFLKDMDGDGRKDVICLLGPSANNLFGSWIHIADISWESSRFIGEFPLPEDIGIRSLSLVDEPFDGTALLKQQLDSCTRYIRISKDGIVDLFYKTGFGVPTDYNNDGLLDFIAPWAISITEPSTQNFSPAFLHFDEAIRSNLNRFFKVQDTLDWISYEEIAPGSAQKIRLWEEHGFHRTLKVSHNVNLPISTPAFIEYYDYDKDGDDDLLVSGSGLTVYEKTSTGFHNVPEFLHPPSVFTIKHANRCNLNGNEYPDLIGNHISGNKRIHIVFDYLSEEPTSFTIDVLAEREHLLLADLNGDGFNDIIVQNPTRDLSVFINSGENTFEILPLPEEFQIITTMDINGSGLEDIIAFLDFPLMNKSYFRIHRNDGNLNFDYDLIQEIDIAEPYHRIIALDVNSDGKKDLLAFTQGDEAIIDIWLNQWEGNMRLPFTKARFTMINGSPHITLRDRNTDGIPDLELQYNGVNTWRFNKTSYFKEIKAHN